MANSKRNVTNPIDSKQHAYRERSVVDMLGRYFVPGTGKISGYLASFLAICGLLGALCFNYPEYLTTADLRQVYPVALLRELLSVTLIISLILSGLSLCFRGYRRTGLLALVISVLGCIIAGRAPLEASAAAPSLSIGVDWLIITLLISVVLVVPLEKCFPKYHWQAILRPGWKLDLMYFVINHLLITCILLSANWFVTTGFSWADLNGLQANIKQLPIAVQFVVIMLAADFVLYWAHRAFHELPKLWKVHAVHHSAEHMDWLAGSRNHLLQTFVDRSFAMIPIYLLGADKAALDIYVVFAAVQAVIIHANLDVNWGPLKYLLVTPQYHHWHHGSDSVAIDTNYAVHTPLFDKLFGTYHFPTAHWPANYGTTKPLPENFLGQLLYPFQKAEQ